VEELQIGLQTARAYCPLEALFCSSHLFVNSYASLYFIMAVDPDDNELITLEIIHALVESLDRYFGNVRSHFPSSQVYSIHCWHLFATRFAN